MHRGTLDEVDAPFDARHAHRDDRLRQGMADDAGFAGRRLPHDQQAGADTVTSSTSIVYPVLERSPNDATTTANSSKSTAGGSSNGEYGLWIP